MYSNIKLQSSTVQFSHSVVSKSLGPHRLQLARLPCLSPTPGACSNSCPLSRWCRPAVSSSVVPFFSCLQSFPASGSFPMSRSFSSGGQRIGASAWVLPIKIQNWFPLGWTGWMSLQVQGTLESFPTPQFKNIKFFSTHPSLWSNSHIHDYWKSHSFDLMGLCRQSNVSAF